MQSLEDFYRDLKFLFVEDKDTMQYLGAMKVHHYSKLSIVTKTVTNHVPKELSESGA